MRCIFLWPCHFFHHRTHFFVAIVLMNVVLSGCSVMEFTNPLTATQDIKSNHSNGDGHFPTVGITPPPPTDDLSAAQREQLLRDLSVARAKNQAAASASTTQPFAR